MDSVDVTTFSEADGARTRRIAVSADEPNMPSMGHTQAATDARCAECGAPMASDQRYCVECGERRGEPRFPAVIDDADTAPSPAAVTAGRRSRLSPNSTLIAFVGTLLLAMGVGVLIGRSGSSSPAAMRLWRPGRDGGWQGSRRQPPPPAPRRDHREHRRRRGQTERDQIVSPWRTATKAKAQPAPSDGEGGQHGDRQGIQERSLHRRILRVGRMTASVAMRRPGSRGPHGHPRPGRQRRGRPRGHPQEAGDRPPSPSRRPRDPCPRAEASGWSTSSVVAIS